MGEAPPQTAIVARSGHGRSSSHGLTRPYLFRNGKTPSECRGTASPDSVPMLSCVTLHSPAANAVRPPLSTLRSGSYKGGEVLQNPIRHPAQVRLVITVGPGCRDLLGVVRFALQDETGNSRTYGLCNLFRRKADCSDVIAGPNPDFPGGSLHQLYGGLDCIVHVHHRQDHILLQKAFKPLIIDRLVVDIHCVVCCSTAWYRFVTDQARIAEAAHIHSKFVVVIGAPLLARKLADSIHRGGIAETVLRCHLLPGVGAKYRD